MKLLRITATSMAERSRINRTIRIPEPPLLSYVTRVCSVTKSSEPIFRMFTYSPFAINERRRRLYGRCGMDSHAKSSCEGDTLKSDVGHCTRYPKLCYASRNGAILDSKAIIPALNHNLTRRNIDWANRWIRKGAHIESGIRTQDKGPSKASS